jgi:hypothetical protein
MWMTAVAQETRSKIRAQGTGFSPKDGDGDDVRNRLTETGGPTVSYRYNLTHWLGQKPIMAMTATRRSVSTTVSISRQRVRTKLVKK